jgi:hypothetical protein
MGLVVPAGIEEPKHGCKGCWAAGLGGTRLNGGAAPPPTQDHTAGALAAPPLHKATLTKSSASGWSVCT